MAVFTPQEFVSKKNRKFIIRSIETSEVDAMMLFMQQIAEESQNTNQVSGRHFMSLEERRKQIERMNEHPADLSLGVYFDNRLVGSLLFYTRDITHPWSKHIGAFGMMILKEFWGEGIGKELLRILEVHGRSLGITRIEAQVRSFNEAGIALYKSAGYTIEGTRRKAAFIDGKYHDEFHIGKLLDEKFPHWTPPTLTTDRLILRAITLEDAPAMFEYASNENVAKLTTWYPKKNIEEMIQDIKTYFFEKYHQFEPEAFAITLKSNPSKMIGTVGLRWSSKKSQCMEIGYALSEKHWNQGILTEAAREVIRYCFEEYSNTISSVNRIQAHCKLENLASAKVMEKIGMNYEATHRQRVFSKNRFWDMKVYAILREDWLKTRSLK